MNYTRKEKNTNHTVQWEEVPNCLKKKVYTWYGLALLTAICTLMFTFLAHATSQFIISGYVLSGILAAIPSYLIYLCLHKQYTTFSGIVLKVEKNGILWWQNLIVVVDCGDGNCIQFALKERKTLLAVNLPITIYVPNTATMSKAKGVMSFREYFAIEIGGKN